MTLTITLPELHPAQRDVRKCPARFIVLVTGRRFGKTLLGTALCTEAGLKGGRAWWVAPTYKMAAVGWRGLKRLGRQIPGVQIRESDRMVMYPSGGWSQVRSGDDPDRLRGEGLDLAVLDECAFMKADVWNEAIRPALSDRKGRALLISTPNGRNWLWDLYQRGLGEGTREWASFHFTTADNPYIDPLEIDAARQMLPDHVFEQEYMASFLENGAVVFENIQIRTITDSEIAQFEHVLHGLDWGFFPDPAAYVRTHYDAARLTLYIFAELRALKMPNRFLWDALVEMGVMPDDLLIADSAEPKSIADFKEYGARIRGAEKGSGSVHYSMKWMRSLNAIVIDNKRCPESAREFLNYEFEQDRNGHFINEYPDRDNHQIDATRYATNLIWRQRGK